jgi:hypothetical protein
LTPIVAGCRGTNETYHRWKAVAKKLKEMIGWIYQAAHPGLWASRLRGGVVEMRFLHKSYFVMAVAALISSGLSVEAANPRTGRITLPVMTPITVKLEEAVNAKTAANGTGFTASIKDAVQVDGEIVIPANSSAAGLVSKESGGGGELELNSVFVNGRSYRITTSPIALNGKTNLRGGSTFTFHLVLSLNITK